jgi:hypothetical protein
LNISWTLLYTHFPHLFGASEGRRDVGVGPSDPEIPVVGKVDVHDDAPLVVGVGLGDPVPFFVHHFRDQLVIREPQVVVHEQLRRGLVIVDPPHGQLPCDRFVQALLEELVSFQARIAENLVSRLMPREGEAARRGRGRRGPVRGDPAGSETRQEGDQNQRSHPRVHRPFLSMG